MVDTHSTASKQGEKDKCGRPKIPHRTQWLFGLEFQSEFGGLPLCPFITSEELKEALKQVQEIVIQGVCEKMNTTEHQLEPIRGLKINKGTQALYKAGMIGESLKLRKLFKKPTIALLPRTTGVFSPHCSVGGGNEERVLSPAKSVERTLMRTPAPQKKENDSDLNTEIIAIIVGEIDDMGLNIGYRKA
ncbi:LOW QUALITY PROTEIN: hypothetical protein Cgig2_022997 [Carnegiea gigantea]|uniref:Uncharacterized protein n=1 Tax=Carnegiea gigantea TaxID=171969 RepID=A0A9Q1JPX3_9CARY|nr:LOW QUALITY PROTEIN: hypothetical protein Cgig2_022997 [Carnegiea gigantea]